jgi:hypothetical protein
MLAYESELTTHYTDIRKRLMGRKPTANVAPIPEAPPPPPPEIWPPYMEVAPYDSSLVANLPPPSIITQEQVVQILRRHGETLSSMRGLGRGKKTLAARREVARFLYDEKGWGPAAIGRYINKDHSSACNLLNPERSKSRYAKHKALVEAGLQKPWNQTRKDRYEKRATNAAKATPEGPLDLPANYQRAVFSADGWTYAKGDTGD